MHSAAWLAAPRASGSAARSASGPPGRPRTAACSLCMVSTSALTWRGGRCGAVNARSTRCMCADAHAGVAAPTWCRPLTQRAASELSTHASPSLNDSRALRLRSATRRAAACAGRTRDGVSASMWGRAAQPAQPACPSYACWRWSASYLCGFNLLLLLVVCKTKLSDQFLPFPLLLLQLLAPGCCCLPCALLLLQLHL